MLATVAASLVGADVSEKSLSDARRRFPNLDFRIVDGLSLPFEPSNFDVVISFQVIEHVLDVKKYLTEILRVLKPTGTAIFSTPNAAIRLDAGMIPWNPFHVREYRVEELRAVLGKSFAQVTVKGLFAAEEAYHIEYTRCQRALKFARHSGFSEKEGSVKQVVKQMIKKIIPGVAIRNFRQQQTKSKFNAENETLDTEFMNRFNTSQFFYHEHDLESALDLMAVRKKT